MRKIKLLKPRHIEPFNEPASKLAILNMTLSDWQDQLLAPYCDESGEIENMDELPENREILVYGENLFFDQAFISDFIAEAQRLGKAVRAAIKNDDPAFTQLGLVSIGKSYNEGRDLIYVDLWYYPEGKMRQVDPVIIVCGGQKAIYYRTPDYVAADNRDYAWWLPEKSVIPIDSWIHLFFANIVFGLFAQAARTGGQKSGGFSLGSLLGRKDSSNAEVTIGENCTIYPSTIFQGPVTIGDDVTIGPGCVISQCIIGNGVTLTQGNQLHMSVIGDGCFLPLGAAVEFSCLMAGSTIGQGASIEMGVVGRGTYIGAGTTFTNLNLMPGPLEATFNYQSVPLSIPMLGGCVGHNCRIGAGLVLYPARKIESDVILLASPTRRVIMQDISYEESDHHAFYAIEPRPRQYPRDYEQEMQDTTEGGADWG